MIAIDHDLVVGDVGNREQAVFALAVLGAALELHADFDVFGEQLPRFDRDQFGIVFAESVFGFQLHFQLIAYCLALEFLLDAIEDAAVTAMQIDQGVGAFVDGTAIGVANAVFQGNYGISSDEHGAFLCR